MMPKACISAWSRSFSAASPSFRDTITRQWYMEPRIVRDWQTIADFTAQSKRLFSHKIIG